MCFILGGVIFCTDPFIISWQHADNIFKKSYNTFHLLFLWSETLCDLTLMGFISSSISVQNIAEVSGQWEDTSLNSYFDQIRPQTLFRWSLLKYFWDKMRLLEHLHSCDSLDDSVMGWQSKKRKDNDCMSGLSERSRLHLPSNSLGASGKEAKKCKWAINNFSFIYLKKDPAGDTASDNDHWSA